MQKHFSYSIIISKTKFILHCFFSIFQSFYRDRILNALANDNNAYTQLIKNLSLPVNRLEKYAGLLKEYLYNLEVKFLIKFS
jgi:hypothetical protein